MRSYTTIIARELHCSFLKINLKLTISIEIMEHPRNPILLVSSLPNKLNC